jgi:hypothetical protein
MKSVGALHSAARPCEGVLTRSAPERMTPSNKMRDSFEILSRVVFKAMLIAQRYKSVAASSGSAFAESIDLAIITSGIFRSRWSEMFLRSQFGRSGNGCVWLSAEIAEVSGGAFVSESGCWSEFNICVMATFPMYGSHAKIARDPRVDRCRTQLRMRALLSRRVRHS